MDDKYPDYSIFILKSVSSSVLLRSLAGIFEDNAKKFYEEDKGTLEDLAVYGAAKGYEASAKTLRKIADEMEV